MDDLRKLMEHLLKVWRCSGFGRGFHIPGGKGSLHCVDCGKQLGGEIYARRYVDAVHNNVVELRAKN